MELKDIAAVSGKPGLFKVLKPTRTGLILESIDDAKQKLVTGPSNKVSLLHEISIYTENIDKTIPLKEVFTKIKSEFGEDPGVDSKSDPEELKAFLAHIIPDYDKDKVYVSDMKKILTWYGILLKQAPEVLEESESQEAGSDESTGQETGKDQAEAPQSSEPAAPKAKKPARKKE